ncbi:MAG TPA: ACP synthase [Polyangia bacterium]|nr:ACP synthase [Polyangia bacterium]
MTTSSDAGAGAGAHIGELTLRRLRAGEALGDEAAALGDHSAACAQCRARLKEIDDEQRRFEQAISFDRFAAGVERAARRPAPARATRARWAFPALAAAAALALIVTFRARDGSDGEHARANRAKGGADVVVRIGAGAGAQRIAGSGAAEALVAGERLRIGYKAGSHRYLTVVSLDDRGQATALYPEAGQSLPLPADRAGDTRYLPDSVELTGAGAERVVVVLGDEPLDVGAVKRAAEGAYRKARGDILHLPPLELPGEQFHRTFIKPNP